MPDIFTASGSKKEVKKAPDNLAKERILVGQKATNALASFMSRPDKIRFDIQDDKEQIVLLVRRHPITNIPWIILSIIILVAPLFISSFAPHDFIPANFQVIIIIAWYLLSFAYIFEKFLTWFYNVGIVTDERVVDVDFPNILYKSIGQAGLQQIQDTNIKVGGFIRSLFDYGDVLIETAGEIPEIDFEAIPHPSVVAQMINDLIDEERQQNLGGTA